MSIEVWGSVKRGVENVFSGVGLLFTLGLTILQFIGLIGVSGIIFSFISGSVEEMTVVGIDLLALNIFNSAFLGSILLLAAIVFYVFLLLAALRSFLAKKKLLRPLFGPSLNLFIGGIVTSIAISVGFMVLILPGIYLTLALYLWYVYVVDKNVSFVEGMKSSWRSTQGIKWDLLGVAALAALVSIAINIVVSLINILVPLMGIFTILGQNLTILISMAVPIEVYRQLEGSKVRNKDLSEGSDSQREKEPSGKEKRDKRKVARSGGREERGRDLPTGSTFDDQKDNRQDSRPPSGPESPPPPPESDGSESGPQGPPRPPSREDKPPEEPRPPELGKGREPPEDIEENGGSQRLPRPPAKEDKPPKPPSRDSKPPIEEDIPPKEPEPGSGQDRTPPPGEIEEEKGPKRPVDEASEKRRDIGREPSRGIDPGIKKEIYKNLATQHEKIINLLEEIRNHIGDSRKDR